MKLRTGPFALELTACRKVDEEDWVRVQLEVRASAFRGSFEAWLQLTDLVRFKGAVDHMYAQAGVPTEAVLSSAEPDIEVHLKSERLGGIDGTYRFECERLDGVPTQLSGAFRLDQSHLPALSSSVQQLVQALSPHGT